MCSDYKLHIGEKDIGKSQALKLIIPGDYRFRPYTMAPVIYKPADVLTSEPMNFSLIPPWIPEGRPKFATHNARMTSVDHKTKKTQKIYEKPTWKGPFKNRHCVVPMTSFLEPIYKNEDAGFIVEFARADHKMLWAAGIWEEQMDMKTGEVRMSFSIVTDEPPKQVEEIGHDRCPLFIDHEAVAEWIELQGAEPEKSFKFLRSSRIEPEFSVVRERAMKPGWEKRA